MTRRVQRYEWRITWRRATWAPTTTDATRIFQTKHAARRHLDKLLGNDRPDLSPIVRLVVEKRPVGDWEETYRWRAPDA